MSYQTSSVGKRAYDTNTIAKVVFLDVPKPVNKDLVRPSFIAILTSCTSQ